jgi:PAS domain S-box-containing protein
MNNSKKILIVDDDQNLCKTLIDILSHKGFEPFSAKNGQSAIGLAKEKAFPVVLIDLRLADIPGLEVLKAVKEEDPDTECIILTGFASTESAIKAINLGAYSYLQKPYDVDQLIVTIKHALEKNEAKQALSESEKRYRQLYEGAIDGIIAINLDCDIIDFNSSLLKLLQYSEEELKSLTIWDITPKKWHRDNKKVHAQIRKRGYSDLFEKEYIRKDGTTTPVEISGFITKDEQNNQIGTWAFVRDISERKKNEETLKRQLLEANALHSISSAGSKAENIDDLIKHTTEILQQTLFSDNFGILVFDEQKKTLKPHSSYYGVDDEKILNLEFPITTGIAGRAVKHKRPQMVLNVRNDKDYLETNAQARSELAVPILVKDKVFGVINSESSIENFFSEADQKLLITLSNQLAIAIEKMQLDMAEQQHVKELTVLYDTALATSSVLETDSLYKKLYQEVRELFPLDRFSLMRYEPLADMLEITLMIETEKALTDWIGRKYDLEECALMGNVIRNQKPSLIKDVTKDKRVGKKCLRKDKPARSWLGVPLITRDHIIGGISIQSFTPDVYEMHHQRLLESIAAQAAIAMDNANLLEQTNNQIERLAALHDIDLVINSSLDLRVTLNILLDQVVEKLDIDAAAVLLLNPRSQMLEYTASRGFHTRIIEHYHLRMGEGVSGQAAMERHLVQALNLGEMEDDLAYTNLMQEEGFASYYSVPLVAKGQIKGVLDIFNRTPLNPDQEWFNFLETLAGQAAIAIDNTSLLEDLHRSNVELSLAYDTTLEGWSKALDLRDKETEGHTQRVVDMTLRIAQTLGISDEELTHFRRGALLHDIGKMGIPDSILLKPGPLTDEEWEIMKRHPVYAYELLFPITHLRPALDIPYCHHEKWDGSGYPRGLKGEQIPLSARIFAVVDVWDALTSDRPYRNAWTSKKTLEYIREQSGKHFDPQIVDTFMSLIKNELLNHKD